MISGISGALSFGQVQVHGAFGKDASTEEASGADAPRDKNGAPLSEADRRRIVEMKATDRKVRQHEQMHVAAGQGLITSGPSYEFATGPDGQRYVVGGEVGIDTSKGRTPEETLRRAARIRAAALAPPDPSPQDRSVAAKASQMQAEAAQEIARQQMEKGTRETEDTPEIPGAAATSPDSGTASPEAALPGEKPDHGRDANSASAAFVRAYRMTEAPGGGSVGSAISAYA